MKLIPKHQKIKKPKKPAKPSRAHETQPVAHKIAASLSTMLNDDDLAEVVDVYRRGLKAKQRIWVENSWTDEKGRLKGRWEFVDDFRTQKGCADMIAAYKEGLPVQRQAILLQKFESMDQTRERVSHSPELLKAIGNLQKGGVSVEAGGQVIDIKTEPVP